MQIRAYVLLNVSSGTEKDVCRKIADLDEVLDASIVYGEYDLIVKIDVEDLEQLNSFVDNIRSIPSIIFTKTMIVAREYKGKTKRNPSSTGWKIKL